MLQINRRSTHTEEHEPEDEQMSNVEGPAKKAFRFHAAVGTPGAAHYVAAYHSCTVCDRHHLIVERKIERLSAAQTDRILAQQPVDDDAPLVDEARVASARAAARVIVLRELQQNDPYLHKMHLQRSPAIKTNDSGSRHGRLALHLATDHVRLDFDGNVVNELGPDGAMRNAVAYDMSMKPERNVAIVDALLLAMSSPDERAKIAAANISVQVQASEYIPGKYAQVMYMIEKSLKFSNWTSQWTYGKMPDGWVRERKVLKANTVEWARRVQSQLLPQLFAGKFVTCLVDNGTVWDQWCAIGFNINGHFVIFRIVSDKNKTKYLPLDREPANSDGDDEYMRPDPLSFDAATESLAVRGAIDEFEKLTGCRVACITSDNETKMAKACKMLCDTKFLFEMGCIAHVFNLGVGVTTSNFPLIEKVHNWAVKFNRLHGVKKITVPNDTRWNGTLEMLEMLQQRVDEFPDRVDEVEGAPTRQEIMAVREIVPDLKLWKLACDIVQGSAGNTISALKGMAVIRVWEREDAVKDKFRHAISAPLLLVAVAARPAPATPAQRTAFDSAKSIVNKILETNAAQRLVPGVSAETLKLDFAAFLQRQLQREEGFDTSAEWLDGELAVCRPSSSFARFLSIVLRFTCSEADIERCFSKLKDLVPSNRKSLTAESVESMIQLASMQRYITPTGVKVPTDPPPVVVGNPRASEFNAACLFVIKYAVEIEEARAGDDRNLLDPITRPSNQEHCGAANHWHCDGAKWSSHRKDNKPHPHVRCIVCTQLFSQYCVAAGNTIDDPQLWKCKSCHDNGVPMPLLRAKK